jgi:cellulose biosynthesis protein BcsQ
MRVYVLAQTESEVTREIYPALTGSSGITVAGYGVSLDDLAAQLAASQAEAVLVRVTISRRGEEQALLEQLATHNLPLFVALPRGRRALETSLRALPGVAAVGVEPLDYAALLMGGTEGGDSDQSPVDQPPACGDEDRSVVQASSFPAVSAGVAATASSPTPPRTTSGGYTPRPGDDTQGTPLVQATPTPTRNPLPNRSTESSRQSPQYPIPNTPLLAFTSGLVGGVGKSTLAGSLAWLLAHPDHGNLRVALLAFDSPPAIVSHFARLARWPHAGLFLQGEEPLERVLQRLPDMHLSVLVAPGDPTLYDEIGGRLADAPGSVMRVLEAALAQPGLDLVIADLPPNLSGWAVHPLLVADAGNTLLVARPSLAGQAGVVSAMSLLQSLGHSAPPRLVLNDYLKGLDISPGDFVAGLRQLAPCPDPIAVIPHCDAARAAQNEGLPLALAEGTDDLVSALCKLAGALGFEIGIETRDREGVEIETGDRDGAGPKKRRAFALPGVRIKLTD